MDQTIAVRFLNNKVDLHVAHQGMMSWSPNELHNTLNPNNSTQQIRITVEPVGLCKDLLPVKFQCIHSVIILNNILLLSRSLMR